jgi:hypothetical protein
VLQRIASHSASATTGIRAAARRRRDAAQAQLQAALSGQILLDETESTSDF